MAIRRDSRGRVTCSRHLFSLFLPSMFFFLSAKPSRPFDSSSSIWRSNPELLKYLHTPPFLRDGINRREPFHAAIYPYTRQRLHFEQRRAMKSGLLSPQLQVRKTSTISQNTSKNTNNLCLHGAQSRPPLSPRNKTSHVYVKPQQKPKISKPDTHPFCLTPLQLSCSESNTAGVKNFGDDRHELCRGVLPSHSDGIGPGAVPSLRPTLAERAGGQNACAGGGGAAATRCNASAGSHRRHCVCVCGNLGVELFLELKLGFADGFAKRVPVGGSFGLVVRQAGLVGGPGPERQRAGIVRHLARTKRRGITTRRRRLDNRDVRSATGED